MRREGIFRTEVAE